MEASCHKPNPALQFCSSWQDFDRLSASRGPSAVTELLVIICSMYKKRTCADTIGTVLVSWPMLKYKYIFRIKYTEAILSNSTRGNCYGLKLAKKC